MAKSAPVAPGTLGGRGWSPMGFPLAAASTLFFGFLSWPDGSWRSLLIPALSSAIVMILALRPTAAPRGVLLAALLTALTAVLSVLEGRLFPHTGSPWPVSLLLPLGLGAVLVWRVPSFRAVAPSLHRGELSARVAGLVLAVVGTSSTALVLWRALAEPDLSDLYAMVPQQPVLILLLSGLAFALVNALVEELVFRVVFFEALCLVGAPWAAVLVQGLAFGAAHVHGFPRGLSGVGLAAIYGLMLGALRVYARGMLAVFVAHVFADVTIFTILVMGR